MKVSELIELLKKMPQDAEVVMFDGPSTIPHSKYMYGRRKAD